MAKPPNPGNDAAQPASLQSPPESQSHCCGHDHGPGQGEEDFNLRRELTPIAIAAILFLIGLIFNQALHNTPFALAEYAVLIPAYLISGWGVLTTAGQNIWRGRIFDENFLMTIATWGRSPSTKFLKRWR